MSFDEDRKRTPEELVHALRACATITMGAECEQCEFFEADTPIGYDPCHESLLLTQAADYIEGQITKVVSSKHAAERKIIQCADCKWWDRLEEGYPYGFCLACRSGTHTERWDISIYRQCKFDFYCADAEPKEEDDEETR